MCRRKRIGQTLIIVRNVYNWNSQFPVCNIVCNNTPPEILKYIVSHEKKNRGWTKLKNSFVRLTGMTKLIFHSQNFLGSGHFLVHNLRPHGSKNDRRQKSYFNEKSLFSCPSTSWKNFLTLLMLWLYIQGWIMKLYKVISKLCNLGGRSYLDKKCSPCLGLPPWCSKLGVRSELTLTRSYR